MEKKNIKNVLSRSKVIRKVADPLYKKFHSKRGFSSKTFWENRYVQGGDSGAGSYGKFAKFKAEILNKFVKEKKIKRVLEFGCGDGNQTKLFKFPEYIGLDVSEKSISICKKIFSDDSKKSFFIYSQDCFVDNLGIFKSDLTLSLDVIYHLVEDRVFEGYMNDLFSSSRKYVIIYASNYNEQKDFQSQHVRHRKFTDWVEKNEKGWKLEQVIKNKYPIEKYGERGSFADFYIYVKKR